MDMRNVRGDTESSVEDIGNACTKRVAKTDMNRMFATYIILLVTLVCARRSHYLILNY